MPAPLSAWCGAKDWAKSCIDCSFLFIQLLSADKTASFKKISGKQNPADLGMKGLSCRISSDM